MAAVLGPLRPRETRRRDCGRDVHSDGTAMPAKPAQSRAAPPGDHAGRRLPPDPVPTGPPHRRAPDLDRHHHRRHRLRHAGGARQSAGGHVAARLPVPERRRLDRSGRDRRPGHAGQLAGDAPPHHRRAHRDRPERQGCRYDDPQFSPRPRSCAAHEVPVAGQLRRRAGRCHRRPARGRRLRADGREAPRPRPHVTGFKDFCIEYVLRFCSKQYELRTSFEATSCE